MPSSASNILAYIQTALEGVSGVGAVDSWPLSADAWVSQYRDTGGRMAAVHIGLRDSEAATEHTDGTFQEQMRLRLTVLLPKLAEKLTEIYTLRDAILDAVCSTANLNQGGYADDTDWEGWGFADESSEVCRFHLDLTVRHSWARA